MDLMTDLQIIQDLLDASSRRCVAVYAVLEVSGLPHFLDMCSRLQVNATHLRVRKRRRGAGRGGWLGFARTPPNGPISGLDPFLALRPSP